MNRLSLLALPVAAAAALVLLPERSQAEPVVHAPAPLLAATVRGTTETAIFAGGCFWGVEAVFAHVRGVTSATSGYAGGSAATAHYQVVSTGLTGHAEAVRVVFDPRVVKYSDLLRIYFSVVADPTRLNAQGPDRGPQYRSALFPVAPAQVQVARAYLHQLGTAHVYARPIVTRIERDARFFPAESYHQDFMAKNPTYPYIVINDRPKVDALQRLFPASWRG